MDNAIDRQTISGEYSVPIIICLVRHVQRAVVVSNIIKGLISLGL